MVGTGTPAKSSIKPAGFGGQKAGHARGHLLGNQLGGAGDDPRNLTTLFQNPVNHPVMSSVEGSVRKAVEAGEVVQYSVKPIYEGNTLIPSGVTIKAEGKTSQQALICISRRLISVIYGMLKNGTEYRMPVVESAGENR